MMLLPFAACSAPETLYKPVAVEVPVETPCKTPEIQKPSPVMQLLAPQATLFDKTQAALIELDNRKAYEEELEAGLAACR